MTNFEVQRKRFWFFKYGLLGKNCHFVKKINQSTSEERASILEQRLRSEWAQDKAMRVQAEDAVEHLSEQLKIERKKNVDAHVTEIHQF